MATGGRFSIPIEDIVDLLGLQISPKSCPGSRSLKVHCPFCGHKGYTMDVDTVSCVYHCFHCPDELQRNTGALDLYSRVRLGQPVSQLDAKDVFRQLKRELGLDTGDWHSHVTEVKDINIYPASDDLLDAAYSALFQLKNLELTKGHMDNLEARGVPKYAARGFGYASLLPSNTLIKKVGSDCQKIMEWYEAEEIWKIKASNDILKRYTKKDIVAGVWIADAIIRQGIKLNGVPGFFHITPNRWCFRYDAGMMIPTISYNKQIVGLQIRRDTVSAKGLRYMTLSSKGLPDGVTANISRAHVSYLKGSRRISKKTTVYITEGPMKADLIRWFLTKGNEVNTDVAVIAVQGVKNVRELPSIAKTLREVGVTEIASAFDMDKCGNVHVAHASQEIRKIFNDAQISVSTLLWDDEYAEKKLLELLEIAKSNGIEYHPEYPKAAFDIAKLAEILTNKKIPYNVKIVNGVEQKDHWRAETKGFDDYLQYLERQTT